MSITVLIAGSLRAISGSVCSPSAVGLSWNFIVLEPSAAIAPAVSTTGAAAVK
jgi:hypothetical protein